MRNLILEGTVVDIRPMVTGTRADGTPWASQTYALQVDGGGGYTSLVAFDIFDETRIRQWNIQRGEQIAVAVALSSVAGREGGYFTRVRAYKVMRGYEAINALMTLMGGAQTYGAAQSLGTQPADLAQGLALLARLANAPTQRTPQATAQPQAAAPAPAATTAPAPAATPTPAAPPMPEGLQHYSVGQRPTITGTPGLAEWQSKPSAEASSLDHAEAQSAIATQSQSLSQNATPAPAPAATATAAPATPAPAQTMLFNPTPASRPGDDLPF